MPTVIRRSGDHRIAAWANGLGTTAEVCQWPTGRADWTWRLSIADVACDGPFSVMPGVDRHIAVAQGVGMGLIVDGAEEVRMDRTSPPLSFSGDVTTTSRLLDGPIADLNLMVRRSRAVGRLTVTRVAEGQLIALDRDTVAAVVLEGSVVVGGSTLEPFDAALFDGGDTTTLFADSAAVVAVAAVRLVG